MNKTIVTVIAALIVAGITSSVVQSGEIAVLKSQESGRQQKDAQTREDIKDLRQQVAKINEQTVEILTILKSSKRN